MAKPHAGAVNSPRPRSSSGAKAAANRTSVGSSSSAPPALAPARDLASFPKVHGKLLTYDDDDDSASCASAATHPPELALPEGLADLEPPLDLPDHDAAASSSSVVSAPPLDAIPAPAVSAVSQAAPPAAATAGVEGPTVLTEMEQVLAELRDARGLSARSRRLLAALTEAAADELVPLRTRRASSFWGKARVGVLAAMVFSVAAIDVALLAAFLGGRRSHALPPT